MHLQSHQHNIDYPKWSLFIAFGMVVFAIAPVPLVLFVRHFKIVKMEGDIPAVSAAWSAARLLAGVSVPRVLGRAGWSVVVRTVLCSFPAFSWVVPGGLSVAFLV